MHTHTHMLSRDFQRDVVRLNVPADRKCGPHVTSRVCEQGSDCCCGNRVEMFPPSFLLTPSLLFSLSISLTLFSIFLNFSLFGLSLRPLYRTDVCLSLLLPPLSLFLSLLQRRLSLWEVQRQAPPPRCPLPPDWPPSLAMGRTKCTPTPCW